MIEDHPTEDGPRRSLEVDVNTGPFTVRGIPLLPTKSLGNDGPAVEREPPTPLAAARSADFPKARP